MSDPKAGSFHDHPSDDDSPGDDMYSNKQALRSLAAHFNHRPARPERRPEDEMRARRKLERLKAWGRPQ